MIAVVCGGRDYADAERVKKVLDAAVERMGLHTIIEGEAAGADTLARDWALERGDISVIAVPAEWRKHGPSAGPRRNAVMLEFLLAADGDKCVIAFPGGDGTRDMVEAARKDSVKIYEISA